MMYPQPRMRIYVSLTDCLRRLGLLVAMFVAFSSILAGTSVKQSQNSNSKPKKGSAQWNKSSFPPPPWVKESEQGDDGKSPDERPDNSLSEDAGAGIGNSETLRRFFKKLEALQTGRRSQVRILHVGDSHIQADYMTSVTRKLLQNDFGNAGRGLVFPYDLVRTNGPSDYSEYSNVPWCSDRNVARAMALPTGISGLVLQAEDPSANIQFFLKFNDEVNYEFNQITLIYEKGDQYYDFVFFDSSNQQIGYISPLEEKYAQDRFSTTITFPAPLSSFTLCTQASQDSQHFSRLYGILLENGQPGIRYDVSGVNGAEYRHYAGSPYFFAQAAEIEPDLVILSLGTNDSMGKSFSSEEFLVSLDNVVTQLKQNIPGVSILLSTPPDSLKRSRINPNLPQICHLIKTYCHDNGLAYWDLNTLMGGPGSIRKWYAQGFAQRDMVHFTKAGYALQGKMLYEALTKGYQQYESH